KCEESFLECSPGFSATGEFHRTRLPGGKFHLAVVGGRVVLLTARHVSACPRHDANEPTFEAAFSAKGRTFFISDQKRFLHSVFSFFFRATMMHTRAQESRAITSCKPVERTWASLLNHPDEVLGAAVRVRLHGESLEERRTSERRGGILRFLLPGSRDWSSEHDDSACVLCGNFHHYLVPEGC